MSENDNLRQADATGSGGRGEAFNPDPLECGVLREEIAAVVEVVARDGLPGPRDLDVALDAIMCSINQWVDDVAATNKHFSRPAKRQIEKPQSGADPDQPAGQSDWAWEAEVPALPSSITVFEYEPEPSRLLGADGRPLVKPRQPVGFLFDKSR